MKECALFTVSYPQEFSFTSDFFDSLINQTDTNFDLVMVNDGLKTNPTIIESMKNLSIVELNSSGDIFSNRENAFSFLAKNYEYVIFCDFDDCFDEQRVARVKQLLRRESDIVFNDMHFIDSNNEITGKSYFSNRFKNNRRIVLEDIINYNSLGFTNSAIKSSLLSLYNSPIQKVRAMDWYFFSCLLVSGTTALFTNETFSRYRRHGENLSNLNISTEKELLTALEIKREHYGAMRLLDTSFEKLYKSSTDLVQKCKAENSFLKGYLEIVLKKKVSFPLWWEEAFIEKG